MLLTVEDVRRLNEMEHALILRLFLFHFYASLPEQEAKERGR